MSPNLKIGNVRPNVRKQKTNFLLLEYCFFLTFFSIDERALSSARGEALRFNDEPSTTPSPEGAESKLCGYDPVMLLQNFKILKKK